tara:strand:+ start:320 stop:478 length:159 start_codon:yes stop_codon:yes gene_type:complete
MIDEEFFRAMIKPQIDAELERTPEGMCLKVNFEVTPAGLKITYTRTPKEASQ